MLLLEARPSAGPDNEDLPAAPEALPPWTGISQARLQPSYRMNYQYNNYRHNFFFVFCFMAVIFS